MIINFIIPFIAKSGGIIVVLEHARRLAELGHDVRIYYPQFPYAAMNPYADSPIPWKRVLLGRLKTFLSDLRRRRKIVEWHTFPVAVHPVPLILGLFLRDADAVIATAWPTAYSVAGLGRSKGRKYYFIQGFEIWTALPHLAEASYRLPLRFITIAPWLTELMKTRFARDPIAEVGNGVDVDFFRPPESKVWSRPSILMMYSSLPLKGSSDGLEALARIAQEFPDTEIALFGMEPPPESAAFARFHLNPAPGRLARLYGSASIFLFPSRGEGWGLPVLEAMACACAVVATNVGCVPVVRDGENILVCEPLDIEGMYDHLKSLLESPERRKAIALRGRVSAEKRSWESSTRALAAALSVKPHDP